MEGRQFIHPELRLAFTAPQGFYMVNGTRAVTINGQTWYEITLPGRHGPLFVYNQATEATNLPLEMTVSRGLIVLGLTIAMCALSGLLALRKMRSVDPAAVF